MVCGCRVVYGTLLGPEATGPGWGFMAVMVVGSLFRVCLFLVSWLHRSCMLCVWGVWFGVVV